MVQPMDNSMIRPNYNAVKINIKKPEINAGVNNINQITNDNGIYSAVSIDIDNPRVNTEPQGFYDYPQADEIVTYDMMNPGQIQLPQGFYAYHSTNVIIPEIENDADYELTDDNAEPAAQLAAAPNTDEIEAELTVNEPEEVEEAEEVDVPAPNYTTLEAEKGDEIANDVKIMETETSEVNLKKPEIIPAEEIKPDVDIPLVVSNLRNEDFDVQAQQMEEIARISLDNPADAVPYIVRDVFSGLIDITQKDSTNLAAPSDAQLEVRRKVIANFITAESAKANNPDAEVKLPYEVSEADLAIASELSPMEQAERNKEYALYTIAILSKVYTDEVEKQTGNIVPMTDLPGASAIVDSLRYSQNAGVKVAAIDALSHIKRPEYKDELNALFTLAQTDNNPEVALSAARALENNN